MVDNKNKTFLICHIQKYKITHEDKQDNTCVTHSYNTIVLICDTIFFLIGHLGVFLLYFPHVVIGRIWTYGQRADRSFVTLHQQQRRGHGGSVVNTLASHLWDRGSLPSRPQVGKLVVGLLLVSSLQYRTLTNCMYWFPLPIELPVVIWPVQCWKRCKTQINK